MASGQTVPVLGFIFFVLALWAAMLVPALAQGTADSTPAPSASPVVPAEVIADPFVVHNVPVDVTATSVTEARERGLTQARVTAFRRLIEWMTLRENWAAIATPDTNKVIEMVLEFSVANERSSAVRYLADLTVRFDPVSIRTFLRAQNFPFAETPSRFLVVVPLYQPSAGGAVELWQDANPWRDAWSAILPHDGLVPITLPLGDLQDIAMVSADQAIAKDREALMKLAAKYGAAGVVLARATSTGDTLNIAVTELRPLGDPFEAQLSATVSGADDKARAEAFKTAAIEAMQPVEDHWKKRNTLRFGAGGKLTALISVNSLQEWLGIKARLARVPAVEKVDLEAMSKTLVQAAITFVGDEAQLQFAMSQSDLELSKDGDMWILRAPSLRVQPPATEPPPAAVAPPKP